MTADGIRISYQTFGKTEWPAVLFVNGFGGYQAVWTAQVAYLVAMRYRVVTYDHRNSGASQRTVQGLTIVQLAQDLVALSQYCQLDRPLVIGHSMGASVAWAVLAQKQLPVRAVMGIDQSPKMLNTATWPYGFQQVTAATLPVVLNQRPVVPETLHGLVAEVVRPLALAKTAHPFDAVANQGLLRDHYQRDWRAVLRSTKVPVTLVQAQQSPYYQPGYGADLAAHNSQLTAVILPDCGHDPMAETPVNFNQTLRHFVLKNRN